MKKWKKILMALFAILLLAAGGAYWAMNKAVDKVLEAVSSDVMASMSSPAPQADPKPQVSATTGDESSSVSNAEAIPGAGGTPSPPPASAQATPGASVSPAKGEELAPTLANTPYDPSIDANKAAKAQEEITVREKLQITSIFMKRFSAKELDAFMKLAGGGLTHEEKKEAKKLVLEKLSEEEYNQLIGIAAKLGLSQGKNYEESLKESPNK